MKLRSVDYAPEADRDFEWIYDAIVLGGSYLQRLRAFCERLEYAAEHGNRRDDIRPGLRVVGFERRMTVAFSVDETRVTILRLFYGGSDLARAMR